MASARLALARLFNVSTSSPWICFGGSYAGSLAAWARLKVPGTLAAGWGRGPISEDRCTPSPLAPPHPPLPPRGAVHELSSPESASRGQGTRERHGGGKCGVPGPPARRLTAVLPQFPHLIFASVASSAPVRAVLDFSEYNEVSAAGGGGGRGPQRGEPLIPSPAVPLQVVSRSLRSTAVGGSPQVGDGASPRGSGTGGLGRWGSEGEACKVAGSEGGRRPGRWADFRTRELRDGAGTEKRGAPAGAGLMRAGLGGDPIRRERFCAG